LLQSSSFINLALAVTLSQVPNASSFGAVFDQYRIAEIEATIRPTFNVGVSGMKTPYFYSVIDYDDATVLAGATTYLGYNNCTTSMYETVVRKWVPHVAGALLDASTSIVATENQVAPWIDMADATVPHYGLKIGVDASGGASPLQAFSITFRLLLQLRNVR
jgi:hypothetical protein